MGIYIHIYKKKKRYSEDKFINNSIFFNIKCFGVFFLVNQQGNVNMQCFIFWIIFKFKTEKEIWKNAKHFIMASSGQFKMHVT